MFVESSEQHALLTLPCSRTCRVCAAIYTTKACNVCIGKANAKWRAANKEKIREKERTPEAVAAAKIRSAACYAKHREEINAKGRARYAANREFFKAYGAARFKSNIEYFRNYWRKNAEKIRAAKAAWLLKRPDYLSQYRAKNAERMREKARIRRVNNPGICRIQNQNRRARMKFGGGKLSKDLAKKLLRLQRGRCACCGAVLGKDFHMDHIMPLALGGLNIDENMQLLTPKCNLKKSARHPVDFMRQQGFLL